MPDFANAWDNSDPEGSFGAVPRRVRGPESAADFFLDSQRGMKIGTDSTVAFPILRRASLSWARSGVLSPQRVWAVLRELGGAQALLDASEEVLTRGLRSPERARAVLRSPDDRAADRWAAGLERSGIRVISAFDDVYPALLREIADPPFVLFADGATRGGQTGWRRNRRSRRPSDRERG